MNRPSASSSMVQLSKAVREYDCSAGVKAADTPSVNVKVSAATRARDDAAKEAASPTLNASPALRTRTADARVAVSEIEKLSIAVFANDWGPAPWMKSEMLN